MSLLLDSVADWFLSKQLCSLDAWFSIPDVAAVISMLAIIFPPVLQQHITACTMVSQILLGELSLSPVCSSVVPVYFY